MKKILTYSIVAAGLLMFSGCNQDNPNDVNTTKPPVIEEPAVSSLTKLGSYNTGKKAGSEISAYDPITKRLFIINGDTKALDIVDISDVTAPKLVQSISITPYATGITSVAVKNGKVAVAVENDQEKGKVLFYTTNGVFERAVEVGYLPDMVTFNEDGSKAVVANEGEPNQDYTNDPIGSVGVIDVATGAYTDIPFTGAALSASDDGLLPRLGGTPSNDQSKDFEPEYITIKGNYAYVTLQENNAIAKINLTNNSISYIKSLGAKSYESGKSTIDILEDGNITMANYQGLYGLFMPDSIASYNVNGVTYLVTANEGDGRDYDGYKDEIKIGKLFKNNKLDDAIKNQYTKDTDLKVMVDMGLNSATNKYDKLYAYGARSFSIWDDSGKLVWDSGDEFEKKIKELEPALFNQDDGTLDGRSGNKGVEPESVVVAKIGSKNYAFIGLERQNGIMIYDISVPTAPKYVAYKSLGNEDVSPEGLIFIPAAQSPNGKNLLVTSNEISGSTAIFEVK
ncbi:MAG: hypothetical protein KN64_13285 [Sulfurovum sp. AS07-7]|nr:MAG: hypothetical protein KN64_13285 [Sulfurovum sp. AS07-7]